MLSMYDVITRHSQTPPTPHPSLPTNWADGRGGQQLLTAQFTQQLLRSTLNIKNIRNGKRGLENVKKMPHEFVIVDIILYFLFASL